MTIYSENKDSEGYLYNLYIKKDIKKGFEITYAKKGIFKQTLGVPILVLYNGETIRNKDNKITNFNFSKSDFLFKNLKTNTTTQQKNQEMKTKDILSCLVSLYKFKIELLSKDLNQIINCASGNEINMLKEIYKRIIVPMYIPILMLVPYIMILSSKEKINYARLKLITFLIGVLIIILSEGIIRFISKELADNIIIFIFPFILLLFLYLMFFYKLNFKIKNK